MQNRDYSMAFCYALHVCIDAVAQTRIGNFAFAYRE